MEGNGRKTGFSVTVMVISWVLFLTITSGLTAADRTCAFCKNQAKATRASTPVGKYMNCKFLGVIQITALARQLASKRYARDAAKNAELPLGLDLQIEGLRMSD